MLRPVDTEPSQNADDDDGRDPTDDDDKPADPRLHPSVLAVQSNMDEDSRRLVRKYQDMARGLVEQSVQIIVEPKEDLNVWDVCRAKTHRNSPGSPGIRLVASPGNSRALRSRAPPSRRAGGSRYPPRCEAGRRRKIWPDRGKTGKPNKRPEHIKEKALVECLRIASSGFVMPAPDVAGMHRTYDVAVYDMKAAGETTTHPHLRIMSFRSEHYAKLLRGFQRSHLGEDTGEEILTKATFPAHTLAVVLDGGKYLGSEGGIFSEPFKCEGKSVVKKHNLFIHYSESCVEQRRERQKITAAFSQHSFETGHIFVKDPIAVEFTRRRHYEGSSASNGIGPVHLVPDEEAICRGELLTYLPLEFKAFWASSDLLWL